MTGQKWFYCHGLVFFIISGNILSVDTLTNDRPGYYNYISSAQFNVVIILYMLPSGIPVLLLISDIDIRSFLWNQWCGYSPKVPLWTNSVEYPQHEMKYRENIAWLFLLFEIVICNNVLVAIIWGLYTTRYEEETKTCSLNSTQFYFSRITCISNQHGVVLRNKYRNIDINKELLTKIRTLTNKKRKSEKRVRLGREWHRLKDQINKWINK